MRIIKLIGLVTLLLSAQAWALSDKDFKWKIASNKKGVIVFRADKHESGLVPIKVQTILPYPPSRVLAVIANTGRKKEWVPDLMHVEKVVQNGDFDTTEYSIYDSPWPFSDRSFLVRIHSFPNRKKKELLIKLNSVEMKEKLHSVLLGDDPY